jgi:alpha-L-arabinofuranosidase B-like protein/LGFP repeat-containing protein
MDLFEFQSVNFPDRSIRHRNYLGELSRPGKGESPNDVLFRIVDGPEGHPRLESTNFPGYFLRHKNYRIVLDRDSATKAFQEDSSFYIDGNRWGLPGIILRTLNLNGEYVVRHRNFELWVDRYNSPNIGPDASFLKLTRPDLESHGYLGDRWRELGGHQSRLGSPTGPEVPVSGRNGSRQDFQFGQMVWSPDQGPRMTVWGYLDGNRAVFEWGPTTPFNYDFFIVRWSVSESGWVPPNAQEDVPQNAPGRTREAGFFHVQLPAHSGVIAGSDRRWGLSFIVEGADGSLLGGSQARQSWTIPLQMDLPALA